MSDKEELELSEEQYDELVDNLEKFYENFYKHLAGTDNFEIIPTVDENNRPLSKDQLDLIKKECARYGIKILYKIDIGTNYIVINPENLKIGYVSELLH